MITEENTIGIAIDQKTMNEFMRGKRNSITIDLNDDTAPSFVESINGGYLLNIKELPTRYHGCYFYNDGVFPYVINEKIEHLMLIVDDKRIVGRIVKCTPEVGQRFRFGENPGDPSIPDPNGDSCIWRLNFQLKPVH